MAELPPSELNTPAPSVATDASKSEILMNQLPSMATDAPMEASELDADANIKSPPTKKPNVEAQTYALTPGVQGQPHLQQKAGAEKEFQDEFADLSLDRVASDLSSLYALVMQLTTRVKIVESVSEELTSTMWANTIRLEKPFGPKAKPIKLKLWHEEKVKPAVQTLVKLQEITQIRIHSEHIEVVLKEMINPKEKVDWLKLNLERIGVSTFFAFVPPYSPQANFFKAPCTQFYKIWMQLLEHEMDINAELPEDGKVPKELRPKTNWPYGVKNPRWSMAYGNHTFVNCFYSQQTCIITVEDKITVGGNDILGTEVERELTQRFSSPFNLSVRIIQWTSEGLQSAPTASEARAAEVSERSNSASASTTSGGKGKGKKGGGSASSSGGGMSGGTGGVKKDIQRTKLQFAPPAAPGAGP